MTKEELLQLYLQDPKIHELGYMTKDELNKISWSKDKNHPLVKAIKSLIDSSNHNDTPSVAVKNAKLKIESGI